MLKDLPKSRKLLEQVRDLMRVKHYSCRADANIHSPDTSLHPIP